MVPGKWWLARVAAALGSLACSGWLDMASEVFPVRTGTACAQQPGGSSNALPARRSATMSEPAPPGEADGLDAAIEQLRSEIEALRSDLARFRDSRTARPEMAPAGSVPPGSASAAEGSASQVVPEPALAGRGLPVWQPVPGPAQWPQVGPIVAPSHVRHWSLRPMVRPGVPAVRDAGWVRGDVDRFVLARLEAAGLSPSADADRYTLLRRVALDLTGLPPAEEEIVEFVNDPNDLDAALARVVDRYLASPRFGERWGRHWLDVVRYSDCVGRTWNAPFTYAWRYRDWVIDALNADKPFDRFIVEQLAGDLLGADTIEQYREQVIATGLLALGAMDLQAPGGREQFALDRVDDQIDVTTRAFLGLTVSCARCHDHKYDPVTQRDYYALAGIFYSTRTLPGQGIPGEHGGRGYVDPEQLVMLPQRHTGLLRQTADLVGIHSMSDVQAQFSAGNRYVHYTFDPDLAMGVAEGSPRDCALRYQGEPHQRGPAPPRGDVRIPGLPQLPPIAPHSSGRLELAAWIASPQHPLTARVAVNRVWQHVFGRGIVPTVDDFGTTGEAPTHPELLDHLALEFIEDGWSVKRLVRKLVLSRTYRQASAGDAARHQRDPANTRYWRMMPRRLEVEALRDALLLAAGRLQFERPQGIVPVAGTGGKGQGAMVRSVLPLEAPYRSVYLPALRSMLPEMYTTFDFPDPSQIQGQRVITTVAPQALFLLNADLVVACARDAAQRLLQEPAADSDARILRTYLRLLGRPPTAEERADARQLLDELSPGAQQRDAELYRWTVLVQALMACGEFRVVK
jgi:hypothetical protein